MRNLVTHPANVILFPISRMSRAIGLADTDPAVIRALRKKIGPLTELEATALRWFADEIGKGYRIGKINSDFGWNMANNPRYVPLHIKYMLVMHYTIDKEHREPRRRPKYWEAIYDDWRRENGVVDGTFPHIPAVDDPFAFPGVCRE